MRDPFWKWFAGAVAALIAIAFLFLRLIGGVCPFGCTSALGSVLNTVAGILMGLAMLLLYIALPLTLLIAAWRWAAAMLREQRRIRRRLDAIAAAIERESNREPR